MAPMGELKYVEYFNIFITSLVNYVNFSKNILYTSDYKSKFKRRAGLDCGFTANNKPWPPDPNSAGQG